MQSTLQQNTDQLVLGDFCPPLKDLWITTYFTPTKHNVLILVMIQIIFTSHLHPAKYILIYLTIWYMPMLLLMWYTLFVLLTHACRNLSFFLVFLLSAWWLEFLELLLSYFSLLVCIKYKFLSNFYIEGVDFFHFWDQQNTHKGHFWRRTDKTPIYMSK